LGLVQVAQVVVAQLIAVQVAMVVVARAALAAAAALVLLLEVAQSRRCRPPVVAVMVAALRIEE
jgi:hypothetical protein